MKIDYQACRGLPEVIDGPGQYLTSDGRTVTITNRIANLWLTPDEQWWRGYYGTDSTDGYSWTVHGVRWNRHDPVRLVGRVRPALRYIREVAARSLHIAGK